MKSIYSKLICGFLMTILFSFSVTGYIALRSNSDQIESLAEEEVKDTSDFVASLLENLNGNNIDDTIEKYALSSVNTITVCNDSVYNLYGNDNIALKKDKVQEFYHDKDKNEYFFIQRNVLSYSCCHMIKHFFE